jgi:FlaA1/EpsC-like NDP-sugar epimerase
VKIVDLARDLITLSGLRPGEDIEIVFTGMRPGEKLFEELSTAAEHAEKTRHPKVFIGKIKPHVWADVVDGVNHLLGAADETDTGVDTGAAIDRVRAALVALVPECRFVRPHVPGRKTSPRGERALTGPHELPLAAGGAIRN